MDLVDTPTAVMLIVLEGREDMNNPKRVQRWIYNQARSGRLTRHGQGRNGARWSLAEIKSIMHQG